MTGLILPPASVGSKLWQVQWPQIMFFTDHCFFHMRNGCHKPESVYLATVVFFGGYQSSLSPYGMVLRRHLAEGCSGNRWLLLGLALLHKIKHTYYRETALLLGINV